MTAFTTDQWMIVALGVRARRAPRHGVPRQPEMEAPLPRGGRAARGGRGRERPGCAASMTSSSRCAAPRTGTGHAAATRRPTRPKHAAAPRRSGRPSPGSARRRRSRALRLAGPQRRLRRRQPGDRHAVGRGADVIEADALAEGDAGRIAAMLAADAELEVGRAPPGPARPRSRSARRRPRRRG